MDTQPPRPFSRFARLKSWMSQHPGRTTALIASMVILAATLIAVTILLSQPKPLKQPSVKKPIIVVPKQKFYSPLTGNEVADETLLTRPVTAIMIENSPDARPQSGLRDAEIVYEAVAEGGITRFMALYQQNQPQLIGPVRSIRSYYIDWVTPYNASIAHIGGSQKALQTVRNGHYRDIDEFFNSDYYWRATDRYAPHNVYTSFTKLKALNAKKGYKTSNPLPFQRADDPKKAPKTTTREINLSISGPLYNSAYIYNPATKLYARSQAGAPHMDREKGQIKARVVIALRVKMAAVFEDGYRESIATTGSGKATIFQNGIAIPVTWHKDNINSQLRFTDKTNKEVSLARGTTWIAAIPISGGDVTWR